MFLKQTLLIPYFFGFGLALHTCFDNVERVNLDLTDVTGQWFTYEQTFDKRGRICPNIIMLQRESLETEFWIWSMATIEETGQELQDLGNGTIIEGGMLVDFLSKQHPEGIREEYVFVGAEKEDNEWMLIYSCGGPLEYAELMVRNTSNLLKVDEQTRGLKEKIGLPFIRNDIDYAKCANQ